MKRQSAEEQEFYRFLDGFVEYVKPRNRLMGQPIMQQSQWDRLDDEAKTEAILGAIVTLPPRELASLMRMASSAIRATLNGQ